MSVAGLVMAFPGRSVCVGVDAGPSLQPADFPSCFIAVVCRVAENIPELSRCEGVTPQGRRRPVPESGSFGPAVPSHRPPHESLFSDRRRIGPRRVAGLCPLFFRGITPSAHRRQTEFRLLNRSGRSRHGSPALAMYRTASTNNRLSAPDLPRSPGFPGSRPSIRLHCSSVSA
jgi:hypothetical protein